MNKPIDYDFDSILRYYLGDDISSTIYFTDLSDVLLNLRII
jgi:hypothetical protein